MAGRSYRRPRRWMAAGGCLVGCALLVTGSTGPGPAAGAVRDMPVRVLQMNLCDSGLAGCYTGRSVTQAAAVIRAEAPDLITLNEVCRDDVSTLELALADVDPNDATVSAFQPALDRRTGGPFRCRNGQPYGIGLVARGQPPFRGYPTAGGVYPIQDSADPEQWAWLCLGTAAFAACTTHLASTSLTIARAQCGYLLDTAIPAVRARDRSAPAVLGGDFNLPAAGSADVRSCLPPGDQRADDGGVQDVVVTPEFTITARRSIGMHATTDHPALLVTLTLASIRPPLADDHTTAA
jgi:hypothetical protein